MAAAVPLLERTDALGALGAALDAAQAGPEGRIVLVAGEAGVGKTALARAFCAEHAAGSTALWGRCDALFTPRPLGPVLEIATALGGDLAELVEGDAQPHRVAAAVLAELQEVAPAVMVIEDLHWADEATLDVVRLLARRVGPGVVVVCTYRDDELPREHPLRVVLGELATAPTVGRVTLQPLSSAAVAELAGEGTLDAAELHRRTGGNPFFVTEVLAAGAGGIPGTVRDAVLARAARLDDEAHGLLEAISIVPPQIELWLLEAIAGPSFGRLDDCVASGMIVGGREGVAFRHELARLTIEDSLAPARALALHRAALRALADQPAGGQDLARIAHHAEAAGDATAALRFAPLAAARAASLGAHREAAAQYARALRHAAGLAPEERAGLLEPLALELYALGRVDEAVTAQEEAVACRRSGGDARALGDALRSLGRLLGFAGRADAEVPMIEEAVAVLEELPPGRELALAYATASQRAMNWEDLPGAIAWGAKALEVGESLGDVEVIVYALTNVGGAEFRRDDAQGSAKLERAFALAHEAGLHEHAARALINRAMCALRYRQLDAAQDALAAGIAYGEEHGLDLWRVYGEVHLAMLELVRGSWDEASRRADGVLADPRAWWIHRLLALVVNGLVRARRGEDGAGRALDEAWGLAEPSGEVAWIAQVAAARAEAAWLRGDRGAVAAATGRALEEARRRDARWAVNELLCWRRRAGLDDAHPFHSQAPYALELTGDWEEAAAWWGMAGCPYEAALALGDADDAEALRRSLDQLQRLGAAPAAAMVARRLRDRGERGLPRGPRAATRANPAGLTGRELDVLALLAEGLRNAEIAQRLFLSEKTVDHHVSAVLRKLDVSSRVEAAVAAGKLGIAAKDEEPGASNMGNAPVSARTARP